MDFISITFEGVLFGIIGLIILLLLLIFFRFIFYSFKEKWLIKKIRNKRLTGKKIIKNIKTIFIFEDGGRIKITNSVIKNLDDFTYVLDTYFSYIKENRKLLIKFDKILNGLTKGFCIDLGLPSYIGEEEQAYIDTIQKYKEKTINKIIEKM